MLAGIGAGSAQAGECSKQTGGNNDYVMWTGSKYTCGYVANGGKKKIGSWKTQTWTSSTALGYTKKDHRWKHTGGVTITYIYYPSDLGSSITFSAWNGQTSSRHWGASVIWHVTKAGSVSSDQYKGKDYEYQANRFNVSAIAVNGPTTVAAGTPVPYDVSVTDPDGKTSPAGSVLLFRQVGDKPKPPATTCDGKTTNGQPGVDEPVGQAAVVNGKATVNASPKLPATTHTLYAVFTGSQTSKGLPLYCAGPPNVGLTGAQSKTWKLTVLPPANSRAARPQAAPLSRPLLSTTGTLLSPADDGGTPGFDALSLPTEWRRGTAPIVVADQRLTVRHDGTSPRRALRCPSGYATLQVNAASATAELPEGALEDRSGGVQIRKGAAPAGTTVDVQRVCRPRTARVVARDDVLLGTARADRLTTRKAGTTVLGGAGRDTIRVTTAGSTAFGFIGDDTIVLTTNRGAADGGPGNDRIEARTGGAVLINGGPGRDTLIGARGKTLINAVDGRGGDRVICRSPENRVRADVGDTLVGPCTVVGR